MPEVFTQGVAATLDFPGLLGFVECGETRVRHRVPAQADAHAPECPRLVPGHQAPMPGVRLIVEVGAHAPRHEKDRGGQREFLQHRRRVVQVVHKPVIERDHHPGYAVGRRLESDDRGVFLEPPHLRAERVRRHVHVVPPIPDTVVGENTVHVASHRHGPPRQRHPAFHGALQDTLGVNAPGQRRPPSR